jgi:hypothetical protein
MKNTVLLCVQTRILPDLPPAVSKSRHLPLSKSFSPGATAYSTDFNITHFSAKRKTGIIAPFARP